MQKTDSLLSWYFNSILSSNSGEKNHILLIIGSKDFRTFDVVCPKLFIR